MRWELALLKFKFKPYAHQQEALDMSWNKEYFAYFMEMGCVDAETEYLSKHGWKKITEYAGEKIAVPDKLGVLHWEKIENVIHKTTDKFIHFLSQSGHIDMMLTPDHQVPILTSGYKIKNRITRLGDIVINTAQELSDTNQRNINHGLCNVRFPISITDNIFFSTKRTYNTTEIKSMFRNEKDLDKIQMVTVGQRNKLLSELPYQKLSLPQARLLHHWIIMGGGNCFIRCFSRKRKTYSVMKSQMKSDITDEVRVYRGILSQVHQVKEIAVDKADCYCFRSSTGYLLLRRNNSIFITGNSGKTKVILDNAAMLYSKDSIDSLVIIAPKGCYGNWARKEIPQHMAVDYTTLFWDANMSKKNYDLFIANIRKADRSVLQILVINIESLATSDRAAVVMKEFLKANKKTMGVIDESTCIKNPTSKRTKKMVALSTKFNIRRIATGSPITNNPFDVYAQCQFLSKGCLGYKRFKEFKEAYATFKHLSINGRLIPVPDKFINLDDLAERISKLSYRVQKKDCLDLPSKVYLMRDVELTPEQSKVMAELKAEKFAEFQGQEITTRLALTLALRLHQIICGHIKTDEGGIKRIKNNRISSMFSLIEELTGKIIIFANYRDNIKEISEQLEKVYSKDSYVTYFGDTSTENRIKAIESFEDPNSSVRFFVGNTQTAGKGITLVQATTVIFFSNSFSLEDRLQAEDRAHRVGQTKSVTYVDMCVKESLDEKIIKALLLKRNLSKEVLRDDLEEWFNIKKGKK
jgi:hypothetical protein